MVWGSIVDEPNTCIRNPNKSSYVIFAGQVSDTKYNLQYVN